MLSTLNSDKKKEVTIRTMRLVPPEVLVLKRSLTVGRHLWHGTNGSIYQAFFSDQLHEEVQAASLSPLLYFHAEEI
jgi:hypothetical protein